MKCKRIRKLLDAAYKLSDKFFLEELETARKSP